MHVRNHTGDCQFSCLVQLFAPSWAYLVLSWLVFLSRSLVVLRAGGLDIAVPFSSNWYRYNYLWNWLSSYWWTVVNQILKSGLKLPVEESGDIFKKADEKPIIFEIGFSLTEEQHFGLQKWSQANCTISWIWRWWRYFEEGRLTFNVEKAIIVRVDFYHIEEQQLELQKWSQASCFIL